MSTDFTFYKAQSHHEAMGLCGMLAQFDSRLANRPFQEVFNEIHACVMHKQYAILAMPVQQKLGVKDTPVGYILWGKMNFTASALYGKQIRQLSPGEYNCGDQLWVVQFCTPFGMKEEIFQCCKQNIPELAQNKGIFTIDLFEELPHPILNKGKKE